MYYFGLKQTKSNNKKVITFYELRSRVFCFANYEISRNTVFIFSVVIIKDKLHFLCYLDFFFHLPYLDNLLILSSSTPIQPICTLQFDSSFI